MKTKEQTKRVTLTIDEWNHILYLLQMDEETNKLEDDLDIERSKHNKSINKKVLR